ncbi:MAG: YgjV family protein [Lachnospiraceae bacterium]|nr:YgjV family protein [Lachnospiraceae bacterium]
MQIAAQIAGILALIFSVLSFQLRTKQQILITQMICVVLFVVHFLLLYFSGKNDALTGAALNAVSLIRNTVFLVAEKEQAPPKVRLFLTVFFCLVIIAAGIFTWNSIISLLFIVSMLLNAVAMSMKEPQKVRIFILLSAPFAFVYDLLNGSIGGVINEAFTAVSSAVALFRYRKK